MNEKKSIDAYLNEIKQERLLTDAEERQLAERIQQGDQQALADLTTANLTYVVSLAHQYAGSGLPVDDLISEGNIGMMRAAARFDGSRGKRFVTFAAPYIRDAMQQAIEQQTGLYRVRREGGEAPQPSAVDRCSRGRQSGPELRPRGGQSARHRPQ